MRYKIFLPIVFIFIFILILRYFYAEERPEQFYSFNDGRAYVTAAHLGEIEGYTCVFQDESTDYAIYVKTSYTASNSLSLGDSVELAGTVGEVIEVSPMEFSVKIENISKIVPGVSGTPVYWNTRPIGFISGWNGSGALRCIFY